MLDQYVDAADELAWRYLGADAVVGLRGQSVDGGRGGGFDAAACDRMHNARLKEGHRSALRRRETIDATLSLLDAPQRVTIDRTFEPFGRATSTLAACFTVGRLNLLGVALFTRTATDTFCRKMGVGVECVSGGVLLDWFEKEARSLAKAEADIVRLRSRKPSNHCFERILNQSVLTATIALRAYDAHRVDRIRRARSASEALLEQELASLHQKLWGTP